MAERAIFLGSCSDVKKTDTSPVVLQHTVPCGVSEWLERQVRHTVRDTHLLQPMISDHKYFSPTSLFAAATSGRSLARAIPVSSTVSQSDFGIFLMPFWRTWSVKRA